MQHFTPKLLPNNKPGGQCLGFRCRQTGERGDVVEMDGAGEPNRAGGVVVVSVSNWGRGGSKTLKSLSIMAMTKNQSL